ncbi:MAG: hypothetical protein ACHQ4H_19155 [Ktedonobacterales bacterium]
MEKRLVAVLGTTAKHILGGVRHALRAVVITGFLVAVIVAGATEAVGAFLTKSFPTGPTHLAAAALAIAFGYAAAITVAIEEILRAIIKAVELIVEEAEKAEKKAVEEIEALARKSGEEALHFGRATVSDAGGLTRGAAGLVGGVLGGIGHEARGVEHGIGSHLPGHHNNGEPQPATVAANAPTVPVTGDATQR